MGRPKGYEREEVARKAMRLFWAHGFHATTTRTLEEAMGINRFSLFAEFGSKQGLYEAAMDLYLREVVDQHFGRLHAPDAGLADVAGVLRFFAANARGPMSDLGCFLTNVATERGPSDPPSHVAVTDYLGRIVSGLEHALSNAQRDGALRPDVVVRDEARWLAATLLGFFVLMRAEAEPSFARRATQAALDHLERLRAPAGARAT